ncbi:hypothetical protein WDU94_002848 [Cyamophila willieti]
MEGVVKRENIDMDPSQIMNDTYSAMDTSSATSPNSQNVATSLPTHNFHGIGRLLWPLECNQILHNYQERSADKRETSKSSTDLKRRSETRELQNHDSALTSKRPRASSTDRSKTEKSITNTSTAMHCTPLDTPIIEMSVLKTSREASNPLEQNNSSCHDKKSDKGRCSKKNRTLLPNSVNLNALPDSIVDIIPEKRPSLDKPNEVCSISSSSNNVESASSISLPSVSIPNILDPNYVDSISNSKVSSRKYVTHIREHPKYVPFPEDNERTESCGKFSKILQARRKKAIKVMNKCVVLVQDIFAVESNKSRLRKIKRGKQFLNIDQKTAAENINHSKRFTCNSLISDDTDSESGSNEKNEKGGELSLKGQKKRYKKSIRRVIISDSDSESDDKSIEPNRDSFEEKEKLEKFNSKAIISDNTDIKSEKESCKVDRNSSKNKNEKYHKKLCSKVTKSDDSNSESDKEHHKTKDNLSGKKEKKKAGPLSSKTGHGPSTTKVIGHTDNDINDLDDVIDRFFPIDNENEHGVVHTGSLNAAEINVFQSDNEKRICIEKNKSQIPSVSNNINDEIDPKLGTNEVCNGSINFGKQETSKISNITSLQSQLLTKESPAQPSNSILSDQTDLSSLKKPSFPVLDSTQPSISNSDENDLLPLEGRSFPTVEIPDLIEHVNIDTEVEQQIIKPSNITLDQNAHLSKSTSIVPNDTDSLQRISTFTTTSRTSSADTIHHDTQNIQEISRTKENTTNSTCNSLSLAVQKSTDVPITPKELLNKNVPRNSRPLETKNRSSIQNFCAKQIESFRKTPKQNYKDSSSLKELFTNPNKYIPVGKKMSSTVPPNQSLSSDATHRQSYKCKHCNSSFDKQRVLIAHMKGKHKTSNNSGTNSSYLLKKGHRRSHMFSTLSNSSTNKKFQRAKELAGIQSAKEQMNQRNMMKEQFLKSQESNATISSPTASVPRKNMSSSEITVKSVGSVRRISSSPKNITAVSSSTVSDPSSRSVEQYQKVPANPKPVAGNGINLNFQHKNVEKNASFDSDNGINEWYDDISSDEDINDTSGGENKSLVSTDISANNRSEQNSLLKKTSPDISAIPKKISDTQSKLEKLSNNTEASKKKYDESSGEMSTVPQKSCEPIKTKASFGDTERKHISEENEPTVTRISKYDQTNIPVENNRCPETFFSKTIQTNKDNENLITPAQSVLSENLSSQLKQNGTKLNSIGNINEVSMIQEGEEEEEEEEEVKERRKLDVLSSSQDKTSSQNEVHVIDIAEEPIVVRSKSCTASDLRGIRIKTDVSQTKDKHSMSDVSIRKSTSKISLRELRIKDIIKNDSNSSKIADNVQIVDLIDMTDSVSKINEPTEICTLSLATSKESPLENCPIIDTSGSNGLKLNEQSNVNETTLLQDENTDKENVDSVSKINEPTEICTLSLATSKESPLENCPIIDTSGSNGSKLNEQSNVNETTLLEDENTDKENVELPSVKNVEERPRSGDNVRCDQNDVGTDKHVQGKEYGDHISAVNQNNKASVSDSGGIENSDCHNSDIAPVKKQTKKRENSKAGVNKLEKSKTSNEKRKTVEGKRKSSINWNRQKGGLVVDFSNSQCTPEKKKKKVGTPQTIGTETKKGDAVKDKLALNKAHYETHLNENESHGVPQIENENYLECSEGIHSCSSSLKRTSIDENLNIKPLIDDISLDRDILKNNITMVDDDDNIQIDHEVVTPVEEKGVSNDITRTENEPSSDSTPVISNLGYDKEGDDIVEIEKQNVNIGTSFERKKTLFPLTPDQINAKSVSNNSCSKPNVAVTNQPCCAQGKQSQSNQNDSTILPVQKTGPLSENIDSSQSFSNDPKLSNNQISINQQQFPSFSVNQPTQLHLNQNTLSYPNEKLAAFEREASDFRFHISRNQDSDHSVNNGNMSPQLNTSGHQNQQPLLNQNQHFKEVNQLNSVLYLSRSQPIRQPSSTQSIQLSAHQTIHQASLPSFSTVPPLSSTDHVFTLPCSSSSNNPISQSNSSSLQRMLQSPNQTTPPLVNSQTVLQPSHPGISQPISGTMPNQSTPPLVNSHTGSQLSHPGISQPISGTMLNQSTPPSLVNYRTGSQISHPGISQPISGTMPNQTTPPLVNPHTGSQLSHPGISQPISGTMLNQSTPLLL